MAAPAIEAFGFYLRQLRERRGLSLDQVESLSSTFPDPVGKAYLSRCENGKLKIAFSKTIALCKIYEVPPEVLAERMRLDLEVDRIGGPDTKGKDFRTLFYEARDRTKTSDYWAAYPLVRDASRRPFDEPLIEFVDTPIEQREAGTIFVAAVALQLGASRLGRHELESVDRKILGDYYRSVWLDRMQIIHRRIGELEKAAQLGDQSVEIAEKAGLSRSLPALLENRARTYAASKQFDRAIELQQRAISLYSTASLSELRLFAYVRLGEIYTDADRRSAAWKVLKVARQEARSLTLPRAEAQVLYLMGEVRFQDGELSSAKTLWREASSLSRRFNDKTLRFAVTLGLLKCAVAEDDKSARSSLRRRLDRLLPALSPDVDQVKEYLELEATFQ